MGQRTADTSCWADMCARDHFVQFYDDDRTIVEAVAGYFAFGLRFNDNCLLIGTADHNAEIVAAMRDIGADVDGAIADGRMKVLDASETLNRFMVGDMPDKNKFDEVLCSVMPRTPKDGNPPRAFGEMVALLVERNNARAALALEKLWNDLATKLPFRLFCAYQNEAISQSSASQFVEEICTTHSKIIGLAPAV